MGVLVVAGGERSVFVILCYFYLPFGLMAFFQSTGLDKCIINQYVVFFGEDAFNGVYVAPSLSLVN